MSESITIARPYAKALFEHALEKKALAKWSDILTALAETTCNSLVQDFVNNPQSLPAQQIELLMSVVEKYSAEQQEIKILLNLLVENKRLLLLAEIKALYEVHRADQEKTLSVDVVSFAELSASQLHQ